MLSPSSTRIFSPLFPTFADTKRILYLAIPAMLAMLTQTAINIVDTYFIGRLNEPVRSTGQAMLSDALPLLWAVGGFFSAISVGTQAVVARREGRGDPRSGGGVLTNAVVLATGSTGLAAVLSWIAVPWIFAIWSKNELYVELGGNYTQWRFVGLVSMVVTSTYKAFFDGTGRTYLHFVAAVIMNIVNLALCWMLIFGEWGAPALGVVGAGIAAAISSWLGLAIMVFFSIRKKEQQRYHPYRSRVLSGTLMKKLVNLSVPSGVASTVVMTGFLLFRQVVKVFDERYMEAGGSEAIYGAATTIIIEVLSVTFFSCLAFGVATATLVSQRLGARDPNGAERFGWSSVKLGIVLFSIIGGLEAFFPDYCIAIFNESPEVIRVGAPAMRLMGICGPLISTGMILTQALFGAGNTRFVMKVELALHFGVLLPTAYLLGVVLDYGLLGVWSSAALYTLLLTAVMGWKFRQGSWKGIEI
ncbi:MAG: MATE family efflux transporter [Deltaproteobacteria bacterium]|nr:MATE family efflux transporter [Deltaproteobacteria bacterium]